MSKEEFKPVTSTGILPINGKVLIKIIVKGLSTNILVSKDAVGRNDGKEYYIAGTSVDYLKIGDRVLIDEHQITNSLVSDPYNTNSYKAYHDKWKTITKGNKFKEVDKTPKVDVIEYAVIHSNLINAIIDQNYKPVDETTDKAVQD